MAKPTYWELLKDPRWQRKRLEVMERDGFACVYCDSAEKTLNVHHSYYERGNAPWEYPDSSLHTLCEDCHRISGKTAWAISDQVRSKTYDGSLKEPEET
jgi:5-methylcytosine-specific restriction endonuclease McrA